MDEALSLLAADCNKKSIAPLLHGRCFYAELYCVEA